MHLKTLLTLPLILYIGMLHAAPMPAPAVELPPDSAYVQVVDGHLTLDGVPQRYWAVIGKLYLVPELKDSDTPEQRAEKIAIARKGTLAKIDHLEYRGFNAVRFWDAIPNADYTPGDGSKADMVDFFLNEIKQRGWKVWLAALNQTGTISAEDVSILDDPETADAWVEAVSSYKGRENRIRNNLARIWDPRIQALGIERMRQVADHRSHYTGLRWADDPLFVVWELANEEWWMRKMVSGKWQKLPEFFRNSLVEKWNGYLMEKYGSTEALRNAWEGLEEGENLENGTVMLMPMAGKSDASLSLNDASSFAAQALENLEQSYSREDFAVARGSDVLEFFMGIQLEHKQKEKAALKTWGKSTRLSPATFDAGIGYEIQSQYLHQNADAVSHNAYLNGLGRKEARPLKAENPTPLQVMQHELESSRRSRNQGPWNDYLRRPPGVAQGVPWLEHNRVEGKPFLCYETQIQQPAKYRATYPMQLGVLASIQDWDFVCWHYFGPARMAGTSDRPFDVKLDVTTGEHPQGYHFTFDEVQNAMMRAMGFIWKQNLLKEAPSPTQFIYGRKALYDPASMDYAGSYGEMGMDMLQTTYEYGVRIEIDPTREDNEVIGPVVSFKEYNTHNPYRPTDEIEIDWKQGWMKMDAPGAKVFGGSMQPVGDQISFGDGVSLSRVEIVNPENMPYPMGEENYIGFAVYSEDEQPLESSAKIGMSLVSTSFNTGFHTSSTSESGKNEAGELPVLVARVGGTLTAPWLSGKTYRFLDWHGVVLKEGTLTEGSIDIPSDLPVFLVEITAAE